MTTNKTQEQEQILRQAFRTMDAHQAQEIREAYYKAVEGLHTLSEKLAIADARMPGPTNELLIREHLIACEAITAMQKSELGRVL